ncbi:MAG: 30S ribosomal protein S6 [Candidatus Omnitrophota bacterium]
MHKYEAVVIVKPDLTEEEKKSLFAQIHDMIIKHKGEIISGAVWQERRKLTFPIKKCLEGIYYLVSFSSDPLAVKDIRQAFSLNEAILRTLFTKL